jgi:hypothetical protein
MREKKRQEREYKITQEQLKTGVRISLKSLEHIIAVYRNVGVLLRCLVHDWRCLGGPLIALRGLGVVASSIWKLQNFPVCERIGSGPVAPTWILIGHLP